MNDNECFDYVIVGGGTAGALLANRLTEDSKTTVCLLEAGPPDNHPYIHIPAGFIKILSNPSYTWPFQSEPSAGTAGRAIPATQGKTLGGSSSINGMIYNRCQRNDYDHWAQLGNAGWGYDDILPYFKRSERRLGGDDRYRGHDGELVVSDSDWRHPLCDAFIESAVSQGVPRNPDYNGPTQAGTGYTQRNINRGWRWSSARAFLRPAKGRRNLEIRTDAHVMAVICEGRRAIGVRHGRAGHPNTRNTVTARREVIVSAGAINTPKLLHVSGIGAGDMLSSLGIPVVHDLPGVGENFQDHYCVRLVMRAKGVTTINEKSRGPRLAVEVARWMMKRPSILGLSPSVSYMFWKSNEALDAPDLQAVFAPASYKAGIVGELDEFPGMTLGFYQQRPQSTGYVRARSANPFEKPLIQPNYLASETDRNVLVAGLKLGRRVLGAPPLAPYVVGEELPGPQTRADEDLLEYCRNVGSTVYHFAGTARMGPAQDPRCVVDSQLRVHGMDGLRIVDASVMPTVTSGNTCIPVLMIAEKAADMIRGRSAPAAETPDEPAQTAAARR
ncbi:GMC family oxidoreductase N-terminal domain-containing protein [Marivibrio halodurans]|uniref:GMC family oxidoreductase N-terminal domain-containing protein n=1 Tax=Marivibrio halodurans TaxID=2039722 RepID=A0A8J7S4D1_9PROT|nr:GMC family oxidoreductase N-terminal domain-containing protein [Marivibrio halodurans]